MITDAITKLRGLPQFCIAEDADKEVLINVLNGCVVAAEAEDVKEGLFKTRQVATGRLFLIYSPNNGAYDNGNTLTLDGDMIAKYVTAMELQAASLKK